MQFCTSIKEHFLPEQLSTSRCDLRTQKTQRLFYFFFFFSFNHTSKPRKGPNSITSRVAGPRFPGAFRRLKGQVEREGEQNPASAAHGALWVLLNIWWCICRVRDPGKRGGPSASHSESWFQPSNEQGVIAVLWACPTVWTEPFLICFSVE